jgi:hypothetical protein
MSNTKLVITSGKPYLDIDAYGAIVAYAELLRAQSNDAQAVSTSTLNESIPPLPGLGLIFRRFWNPHHTTVFQSSIRPTPHTLMTLFLWIKSWK